MAQYLRPDSQKITGGSVNYGGYTSIDEAIRNDADFWNTANNIAGSDVGLLVGLSNPAQTPGSGTCTVRYTHARSNSSASPRAPVSDGSNTQLTVQLVQLSTGAVLDQANITATLAEETVTTSGDGTFAENTFTFDGSQVTSWNDLAVWLIFSGGGSGSPANRRGVASSWVEVEVPDAGSSTNVTASGNIGTITRSAPEGEVSVFAKDTILRVSFPTPTNPVSGTQQFRVYARYKKISNTDPIGGSSAYINFRLYEAGADKTSLSTSNFVYSTTGEVVTVDWDASLLADSTGAGVELYIEGKAYQDRAIEIGAVEWAVRHGAVAQTTEVYVRVGGVWKLATPYVKVGGAWKQANPFVKVSGAWKGT